MSRIDEIQDSIKIDSIYSHDGRNVPRVTTVLSDMIHEEYLMRWANNLGFKRRSYTNARDEAAMYGTIAHNAIEKYLNKSEDDYDTNVAFESFKLWWEIVTREGNKVTILGQEETLTCPYYGGTYDLLLEINGGIYLVDFKTSNYMNYKYYLQLSAYRRMLRDCKGIEIDGCIILKLNKNNVYFEEYMVDLKNKDHLDFMNTCEYTFNLLAEAYYFTKYVKDIGKKLKLY